MHTFNNKTPHEQTGTSDPKHEHDPPQKRRLAKHKRNTGAIYTQGKQA